MLYQRRDVVLKLQGQHAAFAASYRVTAYKPGANVHTGGSATPVRVRKGHGFSVNDKFFRWPGEGGSVATAVRTVTAVTLGTTYDDLTYTGNAVTFSTGDTLLNLGADSAANGATPAYDGSPVATYRYMDGTTVETNSTVLTGSDGEYQYWHRGRYSIWELVRTSAGAVADFREDAYVAEEDDNTILQAHKRATGGIGTAADPYTGWETVFAEAMARGAGIAFTFGYPHARIHFAAGIYETTTNGFMSTGSTGSIVPLGLTVTGDGPLNSIIRWGTLASAKWMFDNYASDTYTPTWAMATFRDVGFFGYKSATGQESGIDYGDISANAKFFRMFTAASERDYVFDNCRFEAFDEVFHWLGSNVVSEFNFVRCFFCRIRKRLFYLSNPQSVATDFSQCHAQIIFGDIFSIGPQHTSSPTGSAAAMKWYGGSICLQNDAAATLVGTARWVVRQYVASTDSVLYSALESDLDSNIGISDNPIGIFRDLYLELGKDDTGLVYAPSLTAGTMHFVFENIRVRRPSATTHKEIVQLGYWKTAHFVRCAFYEEDTTNAQIRFRLKGASNAQGLPGAVIFERCQFGADDWNDRCLNDTAAVGRYSSINCWGLVGSQSTKTPQDFEINGLFTGYREGSARLITQGLLAGNAQWPRYASGVATGAVSLVLPDNFFLSRIRMFFPGGGQALPLAYRLANSDDTIIYGETETTLQSDEQHMVIEVGATLGTGATNRTVKISAINGGAGSYDGVQGGYCTVEGY